MDVTNSGNIFVRIAPGSPFSETVQTYQTSEGITIQVEKPPVIGEPIIKLFYRISCRPLSSSRQPLKIQGLPNKKAGILPDKVAK